MIRVRIPDEILSAAHDRSKARGRSDWAEADRLRHVIEDAGWRVVDTGVDFRLEPARPQDIETDGSRVHGSSESVPSRLAEPADRAVTVIVLLDAGEPADFMTAGPEDATEEDRHLVVVTGQASDAQPAAGIEIVRMLDSAPLGDRLNAALRRSRGGVIAILDPPCAYRGAILDALSRGLDDAEVAVVGGSGRRTEDLRSFAPVDVEADVVGLECMAFRREDMIALGPIEPRFRDIGLLGAWLSLALRFGSTAPDLDDPPTPRAASVVTLDEPACGPRLTGAAATDPVARRAVRRDFYRIREAFGPLLARKPSTRA